MDGIDDTELSRPRAIDKSGQVMPKLDKHGLPLSPQPSGRKDDPLVSPPHNDGEGKTDPDSELVEHSQDSYMSSSIAPRPDRAHGLGPRESSICATV